LADPPEEDLLLTESELVKLELATVTIPMPLINSSSNTTADLVVAAVVRCSYNDREEGEDWMAGAADEIG
jgi:hypothetical protein